MVSKKRGLGRGLDALLGVPKVAALEAQAKKAGIGLWQNLKVRKIIETEQAAEVLEAI